MKLRYKMKITQVKITTIDKPINLPDKGDTIDLDDFRLAIRDKYKDLIKQHTTDFFEPAVHLTFEENE